MLKIYLRLKKVLSLLLTVTLFNQFSGNFIKNQPIGEGKLYWPNEEVCSCKIEANICKGATGRECVWQFNLTIDHSDHSFVTISNL